MGYLGPYGVYMRISLQILVVMLVAVARVSEAQTWNLYDVAYDAANEAHEHYIIGGEGRVGEAIKFCHASITVKTAFNAATARCFAMDMTGTLLYLSEFKDASAKPIGFLIENGSYIGRNTPYLITVPPDEIDALAQTVKAGVLDAVPELKSVLLPKALQN